MTLKEDKKVIKCKACDKSFETDRQLHGHLKVHKMRMAEYYQTYYERRDKYDGGMIKFKNKDYYFETEFNSRNNLRLWLKDQAPDSAKEYCKELLINRKNKKSLIFAPTQVELRTLMMPPVQVYNKLFGDYYKLCEEVGLRSKYRRPQNNEDFKSITKDNFKIYIDTREQKPLGFNVRTQIKNLKFGDYAFSHPINKSNCYIERKSISDFISTMSGGFDRFVNEVERAGEAGASLVVMIEKNLKTCRHFTQCEEVSKKIKATPEYIFHNVRYLIQAYPHVQFLFVNSREDASRVIEKLFLGDGEHKYLDLQYCFDMKIL